MMNKENILKDFLLSKEKDKDVADDVKKKRFSIAYDVYEQFAIIRKEILSTFLNSIRSKIKADFQLDTRGWAISSGIYNKEKTFRCSVYKKSWVDQNKKPLYSLYVELATTYKSSYGIAKNSEINKGSDDIEKFFKNKKYTINANPWWFAYHNLSNPFRFNKDLLMDIFFEGFGEFKRWRDEATMAFKQVFDLLKDTDTNTDQNLETLIDTAVSAYKNKQT